jgi:hypothetical protein
VPMVTTKYKQVSRIDTPKEVNLEASLRLSTSVIEASHKPAAEGEMKEKVMLWLFLLASMVVTYFAMHPNRKV